MIDTIRKHAVKAGIGGTISMTVVLGWLYTDINAVEKVADSVAIQVATVRQMSIDNSKMLDKLLDLELAKHGLVREDFKPADTTVVDSTGAKRDTT